MEVIEELCMPLAQKMWSVHHDFPDGPRLIFPFKRGDSVRVSEQESKILLCEVLEATPYYYSIETPTRETYQQSGQFALSARIDVTVYASRSASDRLVNVELKQGTPRLEAFRKDFEKLSREGVEGLWFHTLERGDRRTVATVRRWMNEAMLLLSEQTSAASHSLTIAICLLQEQVLLSTTVQFGETFAATWDELFDLESSGWAASGPGEASYGNKPASSPKSDSTGVRARSLIYCPQISSDTLLHFSQLNESYRLRAFVGPLAARGAWIEPEAKTASEFVATFQPQVVEQLRRGYPPVDDLATWATIIADANRAAGIGAAPNA